MKALKFLLVGLFFTAAVVAPLVTHLRGETARRARNALLRQQALDAERLAVENGLFSNIVARARTPQSLSGTQLSELLRLRNEVTQLRSMLNETNRLGREIVQLRDGLDALQAEKENSEDSATALLDAQRELRTARLAKLREWVADRPSEMIPELQFLSEESWMKSSEWTRVTDEEYASWMI